MESVSTVDKGSRLYLWFPASVCLIALLYVGRRLRRRLNPTLRAEIQTILWKENARNADPSSEH